MEAINDYKLIEKIGSGGMATVYKAIQTSLDRPVAIKVLSRVLADQEDDLERFQRESLIIARLTHPNIIHIIDRGVTPEGMPYFVMEYVEGSDLAKIIKEEKLDLNRKLDLIIQVCKALSYAHKNGVIHRDIKPANVLIDKEDNVLVLDFGIAQLFGEGTQDLKQTKTNVVMGTISYMSPEQQISAKKVTASTDLYSLGVVMYEMLTGDKPLGRFQPPSKINPKIPESLDEVILRCLEPEPADRFSSADEIRDSLLKILRGGHLRLTQRERASQGITAIEDKFALLDVIKEDRYGSVYLYENKTDHNFLVIKKRFGKTKGYTEAKLLTTLKHENIINILGTSRNEKLFIIVMEYLSSGNLKDRLIQPILLDKALRIAREICEGLSFAHKNRIVHGNVRPNNILFTESGQIKLTDFGLDEHYTEEEALDNWYKVPNEPTSPSSDIFAAGTIFYQVFTGSRPVRKNGRLVSQTIFNLLPVELREMVSRMISLDPNDRYNGFDQVIAEIDTILTDYGEKLKIPLTEWTKSSVPEPKRRPRTRIILPLLLVLVAAAAVAYLYYTGDLKKYTDALPGLWDKLVEHTERLLKIIKNKWSTM